MLIPNKLSGDLRRRGKEETEDGKGRKTTSTPRSRRRKKLRTQQAGWKICAKNKMRKILKGLGGPVRARAGWLARVYCRRLPGAEAYGMGDQFVATLYGMDDYTVPNLEVVHL